MLMEEILAIYDASAHRYGAGRIVEALRQRGIKTSDKTVRELMRELGIGLFFLLASTPPGRGAA